MTLIFSERLKEPESAKGVRIAPALTTPVTIRVKKNRILVNFPESLAESQTYLITVTRNIQDEHGNRLDRTYQVALSTGTEVSQGRINGTVYSEKEGSSTVYLYRAGNSELDSLFAQEPDYYVETDDSGRYTFSYLDPGPYQVIALRGGTPPAPVVPSRMPYGVHWQGPISVSRNDTVRHVNAKLFKEVPPFRVVSAGMETSRRGTVRFTNPVDLSAQQDFVIELVNLDDSTKIEPGLLFQYHDGGREILFHAEGLEEGKGYLLSVSGLQDSTGEIVSEFARKLVVPQRDTLAPVVVIPGKDKPVRIDPGIDPVHVQFDEPVQVENLQEAVAVMDTSQTRLKSTVHWVNSARLLVVPEEGWRPDQTYDIILLGHMIRSLQGAGMEDSTVHFEIKVNEEIASGGLYGSVMGEFIENSVVTVSATENLSNSYSVSVNSEGGFSFSTLPALFWILTAYQDRDGNGRYTYGQAIPFQPSEPFLVFSDTIEVRANWDVEGVVLEYPEQPGALPR